jgi:hypothetical protein
MVEAPRRPALFRNAVALLHPAQRLGLRRLDPLVYLVWTAVNTLVSARAFYGYMLKQTGG